MGSFILLLDQNKVTLDHGAPFVNVQSSWRNGPVRHVLIVDFKPQQPRRLKWCPKRMGGPCERNNSSPKWRNLKFAEISVWKRVSDHFQAFCRFVISVPHWRGILCGARIPLDASQSFIASRGWSPCVNFSIALVVVEKWHRPRCYKHLES